MDHRIRQLDRLKHDNPERWLREKLRAGQLPNSIVQALCALGYEPMVLALGGPRKPEWLANDTKPTSYCRPDSYADLRNAYWHSDATWTRIGRKITSKEWGKRMWRQLWKTVIAEQFYSGKAPSLPNDPIFFCYLRRREVRDGAVKIILSRI